MRHIKITTHLILVTIVCLLTFQAQGQQSHQTELFSRQNLVAWCIVPFDKMKRTPEERAEMLESLGITQLAYDWRKEHLPTMESEIKALKKHGIKLKAVWFWVTDGSNKSMDEDNHFILKTLKDNNVKTELWLSFNDSYFADLSDGEKLEKAIKAVDEINKQVNAIGCTVHLYNHGSWFGEPENQVNIIKALKTGNVGIVYNFHHARHQVNKFAENLALMKPWLSTVNINGMQPGGPMILPVGQGDQELGMLQTLKNSGYDGSIGILSHVHDEDARIVLQRNLDGLKKLLKQMGEDAALKTYDR